MCWMINLERKSLKLETMEYKKYSSFTFLDPLKHLFGFTINQQVRGSPHSKRTAETPMRVN